MPYTQHGLPWAPKSDTSHDAAIAAQRFIGQQGAAVLGYLTGCGHLGSTQKEACDVLSIGRPSACARFNALERAGWIRKTNARREGCAVYIIVER